MTVKYVQVVFLKYTAVLVLSAPSLCTDFQFCFAGYYEFRLCPLQNRSAPATKECLDKNLLQRPDGSTK